MIRRTIYLIRHGQYDPELGKDEKPLGTGLTEVGREQAEKTAAFLAQIPFTAIHSSSMIRAIQTARSIASKHVGLEVQVSDLLWEIVPPVPYLAMKYVKEISPELIARDRQQAEKAYTTYFKPASEENEIDAIICHGNLIRYFTCNVLQISPLIWMNFETYNCSISTIEIDPHANTILLSYNESGHLPEALKTQNLFPMGIGKKEEETSHPEENKKA